jgi:hypothetical protein
MKKLWIVVAVCAVLLLAGLGAAGYFAVRLFESSELYITEPDTLGGRPKLPGSEHTATVDRLADELSWPTGTAAVYGRADGTDLLLVVGGTLGFDLPGRRMATVLNTLEKEGMATAELWPKAPWPFDGLVRCGQTTYLNAPAAVCAWSDDGTLGVIIAPAGSAGAMRDGFATLRTQLEMRGNQFAK